MKTHIWGIQLILVVAATGCVSEPEADEKTRRSYDDLLKDLQEEITYGGARSPNLPALYREYDVTSILLDIARNPNLDWYTRLTKYKIENEDDAIRLRGSIWDRIFKIFDHFRDERGYRFQIEAYNDRTIPYLTRWWTLRNFKNANNPEVRDFFIYILENHTRKKWYTADGLLVLRYLQNSIKFNPNHLWTTRTKKAYVEYLDMLEQYAKDHQGQNNIPCANTIEEARRAIAKLDGNQ